MTSESNRISSASTAYVQGVCSSWGWTWQPMSQEGDDGIDGLLYLRTKKINEEAPDDRRSWKHSFTGGMIHIQVKSGTSYVVGDDASYFFLKFPKLEEKRTIWRLSLLPCAIVFVQSAPPGKIPSHAWWANLKADETYTDDGKIKIPKKNRFQPGIECVKPFSVLARRQMLGNNLQIIQAPKSINALTSKPLKWEAWKFYKEWKQSAFIHPSLGKIIINRTGWSHITRPSRPVQRITHSFLLLPTAKKIIEEAKGWRVLSRAPHIKNNPDGSCTIVDFIGITARVQSSSRESSEVMVVLRRRTKIQTVNLIESQQKETSITTKTEEVQIFPEVNVWFYTVYEPGRGKKQM